MIDSMIKRIGSARIWVTGIEPPTVIPQMADYMYNTRGTYDSEKAEADSGDEESGYSLDRPEFLSEERRIVRRRRFRRLLSKV